MGEPGVGAKTFALMATACSLALATVAFAQPLPAGQLAPAGGTLKSDPPPPDGLSSAREVVRIMLPAERRQEIVRALTQTVINNLRGSTLGRAEDAGLRAIVDRYLAALPEQLGPVGQRHMPWIENAMAEAYARQFSVEELRQIAEFGKTAAGARFLSLGMTILSDPAVVRANQAFFNDAAQAANVGAPQLRATVNEYLAKRPDLARRLQAQARQQEQQRKPSP